MVCLQSLEIKVKVIIERQTESRPKSPRSDDERGLFDVENDSDLQQHIFERV